MYMYAYVRYLWQLLMYVLMYVFVYYYVEGFFSLGGTSSPTPVSWAVDLPQGLSVTRSVITRTVMLQS